MTGASLEEKLRHLAAIALHHPSLRGPQRFMKQKDRGILVFRTAETQEGKRGGEPDKTVEGRQPYFPLRES
jgi:hypothetical protein